jgi:membrane-bound serine protease (ClpP class)
VRCGALVAFAALAVALSTASWAQKHESAPVVLQLRLRDTIQPVTAAYVARGLAQAASQHADAIVLELSTPGGLLDSTRDIVEKIEASPVPVIVYVAPSGSRAASAGFFVLEAADVAAMAPGTNAGAAHPVFAGAQPDPILKQKTENDAAAFLRSYVERRGRNVAAAEDAVRNSKAYSADEAQQLHLIDVISPHTAALLDMLDGRAIKRFDGATTTLRTRGATVLAFRPSLRERLLTRLVDPNIAVLLLAAGVLLIYLEFNVPGTIVPGAVGVLFVLLALFALNLLPLRYASVALLLVAMVLIALEAKYGGHGALALAGLASLIFGLLTLVNSPVQELRVHVGTAVGVGLAIGGITFFLIIIAMRARRLKVRTGLDALVDQLAKTLTPLAPTGQVLIDGAIWEALSDVEVSAGSQVRVTGHDGLTLRVTAAGPQASHIPSNPRR